MAFGKTTAAAVSPAMRSGRNVPFGDLIGLSGLDDRSMVSSFPYQSLATAEKNRSGMQTDHRD
jgi:hypothetical protein